MGVVVQVDVVGGVAQCVGGVGQSLALVGGVGAGGSAALAGHHGVAAAEVNIDYKRVTAGLDAGE